LTIPSSETIIRWGGKYRKNGAGDLR